MIKILAKNYSQAVKTLCDKFNDKIVAYDLILSSSQGTMAEYLRSALASSECVVLVGNVGEYVDLLASVVGCGLFYDKFAEKMVQDYCRLSKTELPPRHVMDKICLLPEAFNHFAPSHGYQCCCFGVCNRCHVYILPNDALECASVFDKYVVSDILKNRAVSRMNCFKVFGLTAKEVETRLDKLNPTVGKVFETCNLDTKIVLTFSHKCAKSVVVDTITQVKALFADSLYATTEQSLAKTVVELLTSINKKVSTAESITGGLISSSIVDVAGASSVLHEGLATYSVQSKSKRLNISPHFIDEYGVVSPQVAAEMAKGLLACPDCDVAVATTGYAGPTADSGYPVGLCYIAIGTRAGVSAYKYVFAGDRNSIRAQACNAALFLIYKTVVKK